ncbi:peptidoglycan-binding protein [Nocardiopsis sp. JB363]|uniref:peptidoglycan-binding domain-containing protein n=1 Tax=Nocardiopsis sp. JB363 TaxID=1434837 RepID=UPI000979E5D2|nr:peptidoglycan-binding protein [Nocardiopsis sp. JB363]SIO89294.1 Peptidoglycan-binding domain 1 [Nocardiopsis sp. JB363]
MSDHFTGGVIRRIATLATAGFVALSGAALFAPSASADDLERTPREVIEQIEAQSWPNYSIENPGPSVDIRFALSFLNDLGYITPDPGEEFTEDVEATIVEFDSEEGLNDDSTLESQTWIKIRNLHFPNEAASYQLGDRGWAVVGIKAILNEKFGAELDDSSGLYDEDTQAAVEAAQEELGIGVDGAFGWLSYKGVVTYQAEEGADASADDAAVVEPPAEDAEETESERAYH